MRNVFELYIFCIFCAALPTTVEMAGTATAPARPRSICWSKPLLSKWRAPPAGLATAAAPRHRQLDVARHVQRCGNWSPGCRCERICCGCWMGCRLRSQTGFTPTAVTSCRGACEKFCYLFDTDDPIQSSCSGLFHQNFLAPMSFPHLTLVDRRPCPPPRCQHLIELLSVIAAMCSRWSGERVVLGHHRPAIGQQIGLALVRDHH